MKEVITEIGWWILKNINQKTETEIHLLNIQYGFDVPYYIGYKFVVVAVFAILFMLIICLVLGLIIDITKKTP